MKTTKKYHYVYRITNTVTGYHYYGSRSCGHQPSEDIGNKYFSSSTNKFFIQDQKNNPQDYKYKIVRIFEICRKDATQLEILLHKKFDVKNHPKFINRANQTSAGFTVNIETSERSQHTKFEKYGDRFYNNKSKIKENIKNRSKEEQKCINDKMVSTRKKNDTYVTGGLKSIITKKSALSNNGQTILHNSILKMQNTKLKKYGDKYYNNSEQISVTITNKPIEEKIKLSQKMSKIRNLKRENGLSLMDELTLKAAEKNKDPIHRRNKIEKAKKTCLLNDTYNKNIEKTKNTRLNNKTIWIYKIFDSENKEVFKGIISELQEWCIMNNGSWFAFEESAKKSGTPLYQFKGSKKFRHLKGYYAVRSK